MDSNIYDHLSGVLWKDENFDLTNARSTAGSAPSLITIPGTSIEVAAFNGVNTLEEVSLVKELNHDYQEGTTLTFHAHWMPTNTDVTNVKWNLQYFIVHTNTDVVISGMLSVIDAAKGVAYRTQRAVFPSLDLGVNAHIGAQVHFRFWRDPGDVEDTYEATVALSTMGYHYRTNSRGSAKPTSKT